MQDNAGAVEHALQGWSEPGPGACEEIGGRRVLREELLAASVEHGAGGSGRFCGCGSAAVVVLS